MARVWFEPATIVFERTKAVHALNHATTYKFYYFQLEILVIIYYFIYLAVLRMELI
jgi:hypothetical protein